MRITMTLLTSLLLLGATATAAMAQEACDDINACVEMSCDEDNPELSCIRGCVDGVDDEAVTTAYTAALDCIEDNCPDLNDEDCFVENCLEELGALGQACPDESSGDNCADNPGPDCCDFANDGECDEPTFCDAGTDTTDCGGEPGTSNGTTGGTSNGTTGDTSGNGSSNGTSGGTTGDTTGGTSGGTTGGTTGDTSGGGDGNSADGDGSSDDGGCAVAGGGSGALPTFLVVLGFLGLGLRRRR